ncbi:MAG: Orn/Lys/Arg decarboxylase N-terminal domain-containing protein [Vulcanimicrobiota bacterium]
MDWEKHFPVMIIDDELKSDTAEGKILRSIIAEVEGLDLTVIQASTINDGKRHFISQPEICCILMDWDIKGTPGPGELVAFIRKRNIQIPIFLLTEKMTVKNIPLSVISLISGYIWKMEDTPDFIAGRIEHEIERYFDVLTPPFFKELLKYVGECKYSWHTPGHMGGIAFLKSPAGRIFYEFMGENMLRADLSVSVPELGSLLEHTGVVGQSEKRAASVFGADRSYFVTNGTSTSNKIVFHSCVTQGDVVLVDRNCHKSLIHAIIMTGAVPLYLVPSRNAYGIIGPVSPLEYEPAAIKEKIASSPLLKDRTPDKIKLAIVTNSTYDGICCNVESIVESLSESVDYIHFDEAWFGYARFHELYQNRFGMFERKNGKEYPTVFATQSTHKVLAALSQSSMIHIRDGRNTIEHERFNEAYMMHTSTSPQYTVIASLDVASRMMEQNFGRALIEETLVEAVLFREKMELIHAEFEARQQHRWWFKVWQPAGISSGDKDISSITGRSERWALTPDERWHGFPGLREGFAMLDPIKVTILTPGVAPDGKVESRGIPACVVSAFLRNRGIVVEKTGHYSFLILYTIGITKGKSGTLLAEMLEFKRQYDGNMPLSESFPELAEIYSELHGNLGLRDLCDLIHNFLSSRGITCILEKMCATLPEQVMTPRDAYEKMVRGGAEKLSLEHLEGRIAAVSVVPYPPGIPVIMPGERFSSESETIIDYLRLCEDFDNRFPGFENEVHGVIKRKERAGSSEFRYSVFCVK